MVSQVGGSTDKYARGAKNGPITQVTTGASKTAIAARPGRRSVMFLNVDATDTIYVSHADTCLSTNSIRLKPGESVRLFTEIKYTCLASANTPTLVVEEEYD